MASKSFITCERKDRAAVEHAFPARKRNHPEAGVEVVTYSLEIQRSLLYGIAART